MHEKVCAVLCFIFGESHLCCPMNKQLLRDITHRDTSLWSKIFAFWKAKTNWAIVTTCLEIGAHEGGLSLWLALYGKQVICSNATISKNAQLLHAKYNVTNKIEYEDIAVTGIPYEDYFDIIIFKSVLGNPAVNNSYAFQEQVIKEVYKALKPGGKLLFAEQLRASLLHTVLSNLFRQQTSKGRYLSLQEIKALMQKFSTLQVETTGFVTQLGKNKLQQNILAFADEKLFNKIVPKNWRYMAYGIAEK